MNTISILIPAELLKATFTPLSSKSIFRLRFWKQLITSQRAGLVMPNGDAAGIFGDLRTNLVNVEEMVTAAILRRLCYLIVGGKYEEATINGSVMSDDERRPLRGAASAIIFEEANVFLKVS
ncbi:MAG: hypothetical protein QW566_02910 [Candidatus Jordarchaeales archaeon]